ncbi:MAG: DUF2892 domain-containing protein [Bacteroidales bacterium]|jgi:UPF0716 family protein affecting phage T7 exclusion|nr:DUF2892 domain-containing protein [Bacteroidales bacterium]
MKTNVGKKDAYIRLVIAVVLLLAGILNIVPGNWWIVTTAIAAILFLTSVIKYCPLYSALGIQTCPQKKSSDK